jgi:hypothetical protein
VYENMREFYPNFENFFLKNTEKRVRSFWIYC